MVVHDFNPSNWKVGTAGSEILRHPHLHSGFEASWVAWDLVSQKHTNRQINIRSTNLIDISSPPVSKSKLLIRMKSLPLTNFHALLETVSIPTHQDNPMINTVGFPLPFSPTTHTNSPPNCLVSISKVHQESEHLTLPSAILVSSPSVKWRGDWSDLCTGIPDAILLFPIYHSSRDRSYSLKQPELWPFIRNPGITLFTWEGKWKWSLWPAMTPPLFSYFISSCLHIVHSISLTLLLCKDASLAFKSSSWCSQLSFPLLGWFLLSKVYVM